LHWIKNHEALLKKVFHALKSGGILRFNFAGEGISFTESRVWSENADRFFFDTETMTKWIDQPSLVPFMKLLPDERKEDFRQFVTGRMIQKTYQADGRCFETFRRINVVAKK
jgi:trans-aconitate 2-methyltransferase